MRIRRACENDAEAILAIYGPVVRDTAISFEWEVPEVAEIRRRIRSIGAEYPWLVAEDGAGVVGYAYGCSWRARTAYRWVAEFAVYVAERARRRGVARLLLQRLIAQMSAAGYVTLIGGITLPNPASVALQESLGFQHVTRYPRCGFKFGSWHDVGFWRLDLEPTPGAPRPPEPPLRPDALPA